MKGFPQDLLGGKSLNKEKVQVILDGDPDISCLDPLDGKQEPQFKDSIPFCSDNNDDVNNSSPLLCLIARRLRLQPLVQALTRSKFGLIGCTGLGGSVADETITDGATTAATTERGMRR